MVIKTEKELAEAIKNEEEFIEIEGDLRNKVFKIKATGKVAWIVAIGAIAVALPIAILTGGVATPASAVVGIGAVSVLGLPAAMAAVMIAVSAGGVGVLNKLRSYKIADNSGNILKLKKG